MEKPISTRTHGTIDYIWTIAASKLATRVDGATSTARLLRRAAGAAGVNSLVTNYERGAVPVVPMKGHIAMDIALCGALLVSPLFLPSSERRYAAIPVMLGAMGLLTALLSQTRSPLEQGEEFGGIFGGPRELSSMADTDPDIAEHPHLRVHLE